MAIVVMIVLGIVVMSYLWIGQSTKAMLHHTYYNEKVLAIFEGLDVIARGVVQSDDTLKDLLQVVPGKAVTITPKVSARIDAFGLLGEVGGPDGGGVLAKKFKEYLKVEASLKALQKMPDFPTIKPAGPKDGTPEKLEPALEKVGSPEVMGRVAIHIQLTDNIPLQTRIRGGKEESYFIIPKRDVTMEYEFKRARVVPPYFRHFSLWVRNGISDEEKPEDYDSKGNYNWALNPLTGKSATGGVLFVRSGPGHFFGAGGDFSGASLSGKFASEIGYIYLGGKEKAKAHLNLMAGDIDKSAPYSETFHLYRGATTDFYKVWSTEFSNFIEKSEQQNPADNQAPAGAGTGNWLARGVEFFGRMVKNAVDWIKGAVSRALALDELEQGGKNLADSNALPLYYVVRKDYGYATEWGEASYQRFGFARGGGQQQSTQTIVSSSLHLYGSNSDGANLAIRDPQDPGRYVGDDFASPTVVLGNVYRRCLSLSGYKQRRKGDPKGTELSSTDRKFEVQAGPIEFFDGYSDLMNRSQDPNQDKEKRPIWVWDARVRWNMDQSTAVAGEGSGTYLPLSGAGLFGRLIPGLAKLWEKTKIDRAKALFEKTVAPPEETADASKGINAGHFSDTNDNSPEFAVGISPLFQLLGDRGFFDAGKHEPKPADGYLFSGVTPYFEELLRCFSFTVSGLGKIDEAISKIQPAPTGKVADAVRKALEGGKTRWTQLVDDAELRNTLKIKEIRPADIKDEKMRKYWEPGSGGSAPAPTFFPFSLPDVWDNRAPCAKENFRDFFEKRWVSDWPVQKANNKDDFFKLYFTPLMTNPARVLPYNYSLRFICTDLREIFSYPVEKRRKMLMEDFPPEVTDGIGYIEPDVNKYLDPEQYNEQNDMPLNDAVLRNVFEARKKQKRLQSGYFFMDEYADTLASPSPADPKTEDCFFERSFWSNKGGSDGGGTMTWEEASQRFLVPQPNGSYNLYLNTILGVTDGTVKFPSDGEINVQGGGALLVPGTVELTHDFKATRPVFIVADKINIGGNCKVVQAGLVAHKSLSLGGSPADTLYIYGNIVAGDWDRSSFTKGGKRVLAYNPQFKKLDQFITNIEPRIRKYSSEGN
jgi:hypothetical protein